MLEKNWRDLIRPKAVKRREIPQWLELDGSAMKSRIRDLPSRDDVTAPMEERLVVELYSK